MDHSASSKERGGRRQSHVFVFVFELFSVFDDDRLGIRSEGPGVISRCLCRGGRQSQCFVC